MSDPGSDGTANVNGFAEPLPIQGFGPEPADSETTALSVIHHTAESPTAAPQMPRSEMAQTSAVVSPTSE
jgi:hypothetical protein